MVKLENREKLGFLLAVFVLAQAIIIALRWQKPLIWDSSVYVGMGKFLYSLGEIGFWEHFRPPLIPLLIGAIWKTGLFFPNLARITGLVISTASLAAIYEMVNADFDQEIAFYTALFIAASGIYLRWGHYLLTGIPAAAMTFGAIHFAKNKKEVKSGLLAGSAFLTRFPTALAAPAAGITLLITIIPIRQWLKIQDNLAEIKPAFVSIAKLGLAFALPVLSYLTVNHFIGKGFLHPISAGASVPTLNPDKYFFGLYFLKEAVITNPLLLLAPIGIFTALKNRDEEFYGYLAGFALFYGFFTFYPHKEPRFMLAFLPLLALFAAKPIRNLEIQKIKPESVSFPFNKTKLILLFAAIILFFNFGQIYNMNTWSNDARNQYMLETSKLNGTVAGLNPAPVVYGDFSFMSLRPEHYENTSLRIFRQADYFTLDTCSWYCAPAIENCQQKKNELIQRLEQKKKIFESSNSRCTYAIYKVN